MAKPKGTHWVITGNLTEDGANAYLRADGQWTGNLQEAEKVATPEVRDQRIATALEQERIICDPYAFEVVIGPNGIDPLTARETIRSQGPTTRLRRPDPTSTNASPRG